MISARLFIFMFLVTPLAVQAGDFRLAFPVDCALGQDCIIQNYVDLDLSEGWRDYNCGMLTYDGHKGTDIRIRDFAAMSQGVAVRAAADGVVLGVRNDMDDRRPGESFERYIEKTVGKECGNGVVLDHEGGFQTQYCHMMKGSVVVKKGSTIVEGDMLGKIGMSGKTQFPHLHFSVREGNSVVSPFVGNCSDLGRYLWKDKIDYTGTHLLKSGFSDKTQTLDSIEERGLPQLTTNASILLFWANVVGIQAGDLQEMIIIMPDGELLAQKTQTIKKSKVNWLSYIGRKRPGGAWPEGRYTASYRLRRGQDLIVDENFAIELK